MAARPDFGIGTFTVGRLDGTGEVVEVPITPSSIVRTTLLASKLPIARLQAGYCQCFFALAAAGRLEELGFECPDLEDADAVQRTLLEFFDAFNMKADLGQAEGGDGGEGPTEAS